MSLIPNYIESRIRQHAPDGASVVPGSTPVVAFGDVRKARVATLGLNPSRVEFLDGKGVELTGDKRRLETLSSLGVANLADAPSSTVERVFEGCNSYFQRRPYGWFKRLEKVLGKVNASYYDDTACHLDLVQWATDPTWGGLPAPTRDTLLQSDLPFFRRQLEQEHVRLLLLNGMAIVRACGELLDVKFSEVPPVSGSRVRIFSGRTTNGVRIVGWNINLQSSFGVTNEEIESVGASVANVNSGDELS